MGRINNSSERLADVGYGEGFAALLRSAYVVVGQKNVPGLMDPPHGDCLDCRHAFLNTPQG